ncbi:MAG: hypothetical protein RLZZ455_284 [Candidatus Parcubacteria bacterium]|jgi:hypothetical protein
MSSETPTPKQTEVTTKPDVLPAFSGYIDAGLILMRNRDLAGAMMHFRNPQPAHEAGFYLIDYTPWMSAVRTPEDLEILNTSFSPSGVLESEESGKASITIAGYNLGPDFTHNDVREGLKLQVTLCFAEEWLHAQQKLKAQQVGAWMSSLIDGRPLEERLEIEQDIAFYLHKMNVPMDARFLSAYHRYSAFQERGISPESIIEASSHPTSGLSA